MHKLSVGLSSIGLDYCHVSRFICSQSQIQQDLVNTGGIVNCDMSCMLAPCSSHTLTVALVPRHSIWQKCIAATNGGAHDAQVSWKR